MELVRTELESDARWWKGTRDICTVLLQSGRGGLESDKLDCVGVIQAEPSFFHPTPLHKLQHAES